MAPGFRKVLKRWQKRYVTKPYRQWRYGSLYERLISAAAANQLLSDRIAAGQPFLAARIGATEGRCLGEWLFHNGRVSEQAKMGLRRDSGVFPLSTETVERFCQLYWRAQGDVDLLALLEAPYQAALAENWTGDRELCRFHGLEPFWSPTPWTHALAGRRVLVIHPFTASIQRNYEQRQALFPDTQLLPEFELKTLQPPQTLVQQTGGFSNWFEALAALQEQAIALSSDVVIVGCGAYGLPLASFLKQEGRCVIHLGGVTQLLFGIRGRRWDPKPDYQPLFNAAWTYPLPEERPEGFQAVEAGCYW